jgi:hypothetical protein
MCTLARSDKPNTLLQHQTTNNLDPVPLAPVACKVKLSAFAHITSGSGLDSQFRVTAQFARFSGKFQVASLPQNKLSCGKNAQRPTHMTPYNDPILVCQRNVKVVSPSCLNGSNQGDYLMPFLQ